MGYRLNYIIKKNKFVFIMILSLWIFGTIMVIPPLTVSWVAATAYGSFNFDNFLAAFIENVGSVGGNFVRCFSRDHVGTFFRIQIWYIVILTFFGIVGFVKSSPKHEYADIEHGSSDWCEGGEEYKILSPKKGILLAEKEYLPVDKRGNVNVLIVGRIRFW